MSKLIVVCGATGQVGGSAARRMLKEGWQVRAITRNPDGHGARALSDLGAEIAVADYDDESSLAGAFKGAKAIFAVTNFWELFFSLGGHGAAHKEYEQMLTIASAARKTAGLEHFILHTLPSGEKLAGKDYICPHWDYKDRAADRIKESMPDLAEKTTFLWVAWFPSNLWTIPALKPIEVPGTSGSCVWMHSCKPETIMQISGDVEQNVGAFVNAVLARPDISLPAKYAYVCTDVVEYQHVLKPWNDLTGRRALFLSISSEQAVQLYGAIGVELNTQYKMNEVAPDWAKAHAGQVVGAKELGIADSDLMNMRQSFERNRDKL